MRVRVCVCVLCLFVFAFVCVLSLIFLDASLHLSGTHDEGASAGVWSHRRQVTQQEFDWFYFLVWGGDDHEKKEEVLLLVMQVIRVRFVTRSSTKETNRKTGAKRSCPRTAVNAVVLYLVCCFTVKYSVYTWTHSHVAFSILVTLPSGVPQ